MHGILPHAFSFHLLLKRRGRPRCPIVDLQSAAVPSPQQKGDVAVKNYRTVDVADETPQCSETHKSNERVVFFHC